jgi:FtsH-binding integral membrane protein
MPHTADTVFAAGDSSMEAEDEEERYRGVRGWLLIFCAATTILAPIMYVSEALHSRNPVVWVLCAGMSLLAVATGVCVWSASKDALFMVKVYFIALLCVNVLALINVFTRMHPGDPARTDLIFSSLRSLAGLALWFAYFKKSKRVWWTLNGNL